MARVFVLSVAKFGPPWRLLLVIRTVVLDKDSSKSATCNSCLSFATLLEHSGSCLACFGIGFVKIAFLVLGHIDPPLHSLLASFSGTNCYEQLVY